MHNSLFYQQFEYLWNKPLKKFPDAAPYLNRALLESIHNLDMTKQPNTTKALNIFIEDTMDAPAILLQELILSSEIELFLKFGRIQDNESETISSCSSIDYNFVAVEDLIVSQKKGALKKKQLKEFYKFESKNKSNTKQYSEIKKT
ncbi:44470_t:CDS:2 [Gigaspora margarita]|uniref:44470_t:CDS:1 n=1 Tax=Gigaspora margarita TaxID=4874 RepID=A0ABN7W9E2_GIGMA|nr:44470_t:CDS:2 [Gigaspora margarita]